MSLRYKVGDRVVLGCADDLKRISVPEEYRHCIGIITEIDKDDEKRPYKTEFEDGEYWWTGDNCIDFEATAALNFKVSKDKFNDAISSMAYAVQDFGASMQENLKGVCNKIIYSKGGETMNANEILEKKKKKKMCEIETECKNKKDQLTKEDEIVKLVEKHVVQINKTIKEKYDGVVNAVNVAVIRTPETEEKINLAEEEMSNKKLNIRLKVDEIKAVLEAAENQDKVFEILNKQGIIDKNYNIL